MIHTAEDNQRSFVPHPLLLGNSHRTATDCHHQPNQQNCEKWTDDSATSPYMIYNIDHLVRSTAELFNMLCETAIIPSSLQTTLRNIQSFIVCWPSSKHAPKRNAQL